jgi:acyl dehydratase
MRNSTFCAHGWLTLGLSQGIIAVTLAVTYPSYIRLIIADSFALGSLFSANVEGERE